MSAKAGIWSSKRGWGEWLTASRVRFARVTQVEHGKQPTADRSDEHMTVERDVLGGPRAAHMRASHHATRHGGTTYR